MLDGGMSSNFTSKEVADFIRRRQPQIRENLLAHTDPARVLSLLAFERFLASGRRFQRVGVVSGSEAEPELALLAGRVKVDFLNYEDAPNLFDLTLDWTQDGWLGFHSRYDLVLCEQVLEHVEDPQLAVKNLSLLLRQGGLLHLSAPAINNRHGHPRYFYAGFPPETLALYASAAGLNVLEASSWTNDKASRMYATCDWSPLASSGPIVFFALACWSFLSREMSASLLLNALRRRLRCALRYPFQTLFPQRQSTNSVITWLLATK